MTSRAIDNKSSNVDVAVLILFFNRPEPLAKLFEEIRKARPSKLLLYQDGARGEHDVAGIEACRKVVENIDWDCEVHRNYREENSGCDPSNYYSQKWAFTLTDKCIFFEDDDVPSQTFFRFCKELLDRYEHDPRVSMITGTNHDEVTEGVPYDYFFTSHACINGWATWKRVVDQWDDRRYAFLDDQYNMRQMEGIIKERKFKKNFIDICRRHRAQDKEFYETLLQAQMIFNSALSIVPTRNMINNLGALPGATHCAGNNDQLPKGYRKLFSMKRYEVDFPLKHPPYVMELPGYRDRVYKMLGYNHPWLKVLSSLEELVYSLRKGNFKYIATSMKNRFLKLTGKRNTHY